MPSRRRVVATTAAAATPLAGCLGDGDPDGFSAAFRDDGWSLSDDYGVVARERDERGDDSARVSKTVTVYERSTDGSTGLLLLTEYRVYPGDGDREHSRFREVHDWSVGEVEGPVRDHATNTAPTDEPDPPLSVEDGSSTETGRWTVHLTPPRSSPVTYRFETRVPSTELSDGDLVVETRAEATFEEGGLFGDETSVATETPLVYGD